MILYEYEGKELLSKFGLNVPNSQLVRSKKDKISINIPFFVKAQTLSGKRKDGGGIVEVSDKKEVDRVIKDVLGKEINKEVVASLLVESRVDVKKAYYVSMSYDTITRGPVLSFSESGGTDIEKRGAKVFKVDPINYSVDFGKQKIDAKVADAIDKMIFMFFKLDLLLLEVNPLVLDKCGEVWSLDAKIKTDDTALARHPELSFAPRSIPGYVPTEREIAAKKIDEGDYRGTAGSTYFDLPGDIAVLASGGGASLTAMDALINAGGAPSNYTEYSGNPPKEKVEKLTKIVLSKNGIRGLWVVGAVANFTDIYETLSGFIEALRKVSPKPKFPIVIRRGGPRDKEAFEMLKKVKDFDLHLYGQEISITESAAIMAKEAKNYATTTK